MRTERNGSPPPGTTEELGRLYDEEYYRTGCGPVPYTRSEPQWTPFFGSIADQLIRAFHPQRVLDAGCAMGFLVEALWDRGVEAWGMDVSPYAIGQVRRDIQPYCSVGSLAEGIPGSYDLITCIEVLEHMPESQGLSAIAHMTKATSVILFSSTPYDLEEPTHFNVRPLLYWMQSFRDHGFSPDLDFDAGFVCSHAMLLRRSESPLPDEVLRLYANLLHKRREIILRDGRIHALQLEKDAAVPQLERIRTLEQELASAKQEVAAAKQELVAAADLQEKVRGELELATREIERLAGFLTPAPSSAPSAPPEDLAAAIRTHLASLKAMEMRLGAIEQQNAHVASGLAGITESKIWRTLVRGGGLIQKILP